MKKVAIALTSAVIILVGCEDSNTNPSAEVPATSAAVSTADTSMNAETKANQTAKEALDWQGVYKGDLPCDECANIKVTLTLMPDGKYTLIQIYDDADNTETTSQGEITWDDTGSIITLVNAPEPNQYVVGENMLTKLKFDGEKVDGEMATFTILTKQE
ncbi:copper resistance protein NlpE [Vibrio scophthalmi]|uniref:copper resistance protein NlpE n=1 Tax=Vibrio TaxID=662 RepID=UPI00021BECC1|nr:MULTISPECIES: copper resistance protein NlpE [Vibrio]EGU34357.1 putative lipoprotein [Vibrio sp. N418]MCY9805923.1 copper resistance protein NlpE [Vibrio scophthalmi]